MSAPTVQQLRSWFAAANQALENDFTQEREAVVTLINQDNLGQHAENILATIRVQLDNLISRVQSLQEQLTP